MVLPLKDAPFLGKWRVKRIVCGEFFFKWPHLQHSCGEFWYLSKVSSLRGTEDTCKSSKMGLYHEDLQSATEICCLDSLSNTEQCELKEVGFVAGFLVQSLACCMTTFKLHNVTPAMGMINLPCRTVSKIIWRNRTTKCQVQCLVYTARFDNGSYYY